MDRKQLWVSLSATSLSHVHRHIHVLQHRARSTGSSAPQYNPSCAPSIRGHVKLWSSSSTSWFLCSSVQLLLLVVDIVVGRLLLGHDDEVVGSVGIDFDLAELAGGDLVLEEDVEFGVGETCGFVMSAMDAMQRRRMWRGREGERETGEHTLWLWQTEVSPDYAEQVQAGPEEAGLPAPVPASGVQEMGL